MDAGANCDLDYSIDYCRGAKQKHIRTICERSETEKFMDRDVSPIEMDR
jgi:hypothetical protein